MNRGVHRTAYPGRFWLSALVMTAMLLSLVAPAAVSATSNTHVLITAVYYDTKVTNEPDEAIRLHNPTGAAISINSWKVCNTSNTCATFPSSASIGAGQSIWLAKQATSFHAEWTFDPDWEMQESVAAVPNTSGSAPVFANSGAVIYLKDSANGIIDMVVYGTGTPNAGEPWTGAAVPGVSEGQLIHRAYEESLLDAAGTLHYKTDTNTVADWQQGDELLTNRSFRRNQTFLPLPTWTVTSNVTAYATPDSTYSVLRATGVLRVQPYGVLVEALRDWRLISPGTEGTDGFLAALRERMEEQRAAGLLVAVTGLSEVDSHTLALIRKLFASGEFPQIALAYSTDAGANRRSLGLEAALRREVQLRPFTPQGVRLWVRSAMQWEPPEELVQWLHGATRGLPALLKRATATLVERHLLQRKETGWELQKGYETAEMEEQAKAPPLNLPAAVTSFLGRDSEIQAVKDRLEVRRLVTVLGPGGTGKTRLALQAAAELAGRYRDGIFFVPLAPVRSPDLMVPVVTQAMGLALKGPVDPRAQLLRHLRNMEALLVFDNFEHLISGTDLVAEILEGAAGVRVLATSRERLRLPGESILELSGLPTPPGHTSREIGQAASVQLFVDRVRQWNEEFELTDQEAPHVAHIRRLVEGMPLGLELAAAWVRVLSCREISEGMAESLDFLATARSDVPQRHRSLRSAFVYSWGLLSEAERSAFGRLSVFRGGFDREAAHQVAGATISVLSNLMDKSLVRRNPGGRYEVHELLRQFGAEALDQVEVSAVLRKHGEHYLDLAERLGKELIGPNQAEVANRLTTEHDNLRSALSWAIASGESETALRMVVALRLFWWLRSHAVEGRRWMEAAIAVDPQAAPTPARVMALGFLASFARLSGDAETATLRATQGLEMAQSIGHMEGQAEALNHLGSGN